MIEIPQETARLMLELGFARSTDGGLELTEAGEEWLRTWLGAFSCKVGDHDWNAGVCRRCRTERLIP